MAKYQRPQVKVGDVVLVVVRGRTRQGMVIIEPKGERVVLGIDRGRPVLAWDMDVPGYKSPVSYIEDAGEGCYAWVETEWSVPYDDMIPGPVPGLRPGEEAQLQNELARWQYLAECVRQNAKALFDELPARSDSLRGYALVLEGADLLHMVAEKV
jgi:hypothetical protein